MTQTYKLAIIIPCWNCASYIGETLDCLHMQSFNDWVAFLIDDDSTDDTAQIIKFKAINDSRIRYFKRHRPPKGAQTCRNIGFDKSEGAEYVFFMDADDLIAPFCFEQRINYMMTHPLIDFASFPVKAFKDDIFDGLLWGFGVQGQQDLLVSLLNWETLQIVVASNIYKRSCLKKSCLRWDELLLSMQDADFNIQALSKGLVHAFAEGSRIDYFYRQNNGTVSKQIFKEDKFNSHLYLINKETITIRTVFGKKLDFYLKSFIVVFFDFFLDRKYPYRQLLKMVFVKSNPLFFLRILIFSSIGMRGKKYLFGPYCRYNKESKRAWSKIVSQRMNELVLVGTSNEQSYGE